MVADKINWQFKSLISFAMIGISTYIMRPNLKLFDIDFLPLLRQNLQMILFFFLIAKQFCVR